MNLLLTAFKGNNNSSKILLDLISSKRGVDELYLENDFHHCVSQLNRQLDLRTYDVIFSFEQNLDSDKIVIATTAQVDSNTFVTVYSVNTLYQFLRDRNYKVELSNTAGTQLPNHLYAVGLDRIVRESLSTKMVLLHIPSISAIDILSLAKDLSYYLSNI